MAKARTSPRTRKDPRKAATRAAIIEAAEPLFAESGIDAVSLRQIGALEAEEGDEWLLGELDEVGQAGVVGHVCHSGPRWPSSHNNPKEAP